MILICDLNYRKFSAYLNDHIFLYIWSRDSMNPFDLNALIDQEIDSGKLIETIIRTKTPNLIQMDMVSKHYSTLRGGQA